MRMPASAAAIPQHGYDQLQPAGQDVDGGDVDGEHRSRIGAHRHKARVPQRQLTHVSAHHVEADRQHDVYAQGGKHPLRGERPGGEQHLK